MSDFQKEAEELVKVLWKIHNEHMPSAWAHLKQKAIQEAIAAALEKAYEKGKEEASRQAWLGNATTRELFKELMARVGDAELEYKTTETDEERFQRKALVVQEELKRGEK